MILVSVYLFCEISTANLNNILKATVILLIGEMKYINDQSLPSGVARQ